MHESLQAGHDDAAGRKSAARPLMGS